MSLKQSSTAECLQWIKVNWNARLLNDWVDFLQHKHIIQTLCASSITTAVSIIIIIYVPLAHHIFLQPVTNR